MRRVLHAEWTKLRTVPSTAWLPLAAVVLTVALGAAISAAAAPDTTSCAGGCDTAKLGLSGVYLGQIAVVVLAVLTFTGEYHGDLITMTLAATPRRLMVFAAKAGAVTTAILPAGLLSVTGSLITGRILLTDRFTAASGYPLLSLTHGPILRAATGTVLYLGLVGLLSIGVAAALRHTATALSTVLGMLYLAPILAQFVTNERWHNWIETYAPMTAGLAVQATTELSSQPIQPWTGLGVLAAYAGAALALGATLFITRDA